MMRIHNASIWGRKASSWLNGWPILHPHWTQIFNVRHVSSQGFWLLQHGGEPIIPFEDAIDFRLALSINCVTPELSSPCPSTKHWWIYYMGKDARSQCMNTSLRYSMNTNLRVSMNTSLRVSMNTKLRVSMNTNLRNNMYTNLRNNVHKAIKQTCTQT